MNPYLEITAGRFIITESKVDSPLQLPRDCKFRTKNSAVHCGLFHEDDDNTDSIYVILAHVPKFGEQQPEHVNFLFPDSTYSTTLHRIDLNERFMPKPEVPTSETPAAEPQPKLRKLDDEKRDLA
jgi:hypothetical protein